jgi:serine/threonine protein kinase
MAKVGDLLATDKLREATAQEWRVVADFPDLFVTVEPRSVSSDSSSLKGLTMALGIEPAKPGHDPLLGCDIGGVTIVRLIAEGGMGRVYLGHQERPKRHVAVKVMRPGVISRAMNQRFGMEMDILGRLRHPCIAQIYSAGICHIAGYPVPFFVMEYIADALSLTRYAKENMLGIEARIALFGKVCDAVAHGHNQGIVHRDLKPSNILVETSGTPKIIDYGIARTVNATPEKMTALTELGQLIGTLQYMSPEQIDADPTTIDQRTDVYALGVILYELLTGVRPYEISNQQVLEAAKIVREQRPVSPLKINRNLHPDVVAVAGTCLQKDRSRRYSNATEVAAAIQHCLAGAPLPKPPRDRGSIRWRGSSLSALSRKQWILATLTMAALVAVGSYAVLLQSWNKRPRTTVSFNGKTYLFPNERLSLTEATIKSLQLSGKLIQIHGSEENDFVARHIRGPTWLGIIEKGEKWVSIESSAASQAYFNWDRGQPSSYLGESACAIETDGLWHDHFPSDSLFYAIEW